MLCFDLLWGRPSQVRAPADGWIPRYYVLGLYVIGRATGVY